MGCELSFNMQQSLKFQKLQTNAADVGET